MRDLAFSPFVVTNYDLNIATFVAFPSSCNSLVNSVSG